MARQNPVRILRFSALLTETSWLEPAYVVLDAQGNTLSISSTPPSASESIEITEERIDAYAIPGFCNAHSHAFQYAMAGLAEHLPQGSAGDDFWSWREAMYSLAGKITPTQLEHIATMLYAEMLRHGITSVVEFHYLHHQTNGKPYDNLAEMSVRLMAAAAHAGIQITLLPVFYQQGGFNQAAQAGQKRFLCPKTNDYQRLFSQVQAAAKDQTDVRLGQALHSLRAVSSESVLDVLNDRGEGPLHIHIAEQRREVEDCRRHLGQTPVEWLLANASVDGSFHLVHATHMTHEETRSLALSGAVAVLCPSTEGNLGDGFFPLQTYLKHGGRFAIGTDSHISLSPLEDLRWLDYGMRLRREQRNILCQNEGDDSGHLAFSLALQGGRLAAGHKSQAHFPINEAFDACLLKPDHPVLVAKPAARRLAAFIFGGDASCLLGVLRRGRWLVREQKHAHYAGIQQNFAAAMHALSD